MLGKFFEELRISIKDFCIVFVLLVNAFAWFYMAPMMIARILGGITVTDTQEIIIWSAYYSGIVISSIIGSILANKINRLKFIYAWTAIGIATSVVPILFSSFTWIDCLTISILLGASFGLGIPSCLSYFADVTQVENRGRISGTILLTANMAAPILAIAFSGLDLTTNLIVFAGWRSLGLIVFFLQPNEKNSSSERKLGESFSGIIKNKTFGFYLLAWIMFCLVDRIGGPIVVYSLGDVSGIIIIISPILASITTLIAGIMADWIGRKRIVLYGFISLGVAYAIIGITLAEPSKYFWVVINGITAGLLSVTFILILWGDISQSGSREIYYTIGVIPLFLTEIMGIALDEYLIKIQETSNIIFSVAAFFLFLAVLPLLYAPETLPETKIELRRLRKYVEAARKVKEKHEGKGVKV
jgi:MFS family permease